jgi:hypothetical protein
MRKKHEENGTERKAIMKAVFRNFHRIETKNNLFSEVGKHN